MIQGVLTRTRHPPKTSSGAAQRHSPPTLTRLQIGQRQRQRQKQKLQSTMDYRCFVSHCSPVSVPSHYKPHVRHRRALYHSTCTPITCETLAGSQGIRDPPCLSF